MIEVMEAVKGNFLLACQQYGSMGQLMRAYSLDRTPERFQLMNMQYQHMGEQLKHLGESIDALGGASVL